MQKSYATVRFIITPVFVESPGPSNADWNLAGAGVPSAVEQDRTVSSARAPNSKGPISLGSDSARAALGVYAFSGMASATPSERFFNICQCFARSPAKILRASSAHNVWLKKKISAQVSFRDSLGVSMVPMISRVQERRSTLEKSRKLLVAKCLPTFWPGAKALGQENGVTGNLGHWTYRHRLGLWPSALRVAISGDTSCLVSKDLPTAGCGARTSPAPPTWSAR